MVGIKPVECLRRLCVYKISLPYDDVIFILLFKYFLGMHVVFNDGFSTTVLNKICPSGVDVDGWVFVLMGPWRRGDSFSGIGIPNCKYCKDSNEDDGVETADNNRAFAKSELPDLSQVKKLELPAR